MKKRLFSILLALCMVLCLVPTTAFAESETEETPVCTCETACTTDNMDKECPVCGAENAIPQNCGQYIPVEDRTGENGSTERADDPNGPTELSAADQVQAMINALPSAEAITEENAEEVEAQLEAIDEAKEKLSDEEIDELDMTRYAEAAVALGALAAPMLLANDSPDEQFTLAPGGTYYFDLSGANIPGTANGTLPDSTLHYVPFTYVGTVNAYSLENEADNDTTSYEHSLFIANYNVTHTVSWDALNTAGLIFGKDYAAGGVDYTLRAPSVGSNSIGSGDSQRGVPQSNEWDTMLNKNSGYIQNWNEMYSWGQDAFSGGASYRAVRGCDSARYWISVNAAYSNPSVGFRPVLEVLNSDTLGSDGMKVVTLDLNGGKLGGSSEDIQIIVKNGESFTAPSAEGLPLPDGISEDSQLYWSDENGNCYKPGDTVPADVSMLSITGDYEVIYLPGTYGTGSAVTDMKPHNNILTLRGALFTRAGYTQVGWSTVDGGEKVYDFKDIYTKNEALTLYPVWNTNKYTITFDTNGGSEIAPITQDYGTEITVPDNPTRKGYTFKGWDKEIPETMPAENIKVKAQWEINH